MFDIGWTEMLVIAIVMIVVVGPKDLPQMLRAFGKMTAKLKGMAGDFQKQFNDAMREAELDDIRQSIDSLRSIDPRTQIRKQFNPFEKAAQDISAELDSLKPSPAPSTEPATHAAEPLKTGPLGVSAAAVSADSVSQPAKPERASGKKTPAKQPSGPATRRGGRKAATGKEEETLKPSPALSTEPATQAAEPLKTRPVSASGKTPPDTVVAAPAKSARASGRKSAAAVAPSGRASEAKARSQSAPKRAAASRKPSGSTK